MAAKTKSKVGKSAAKPARRAQKSKPTKAAPARARARARVTARVSPLRGMPVEDWVKTKVTGWQRLTVQKLLSVARRAAPDASVSIKWGQPVFDHNGPLAFIKPAKAHVTFGFWRGAEIEDVSGVLDGSGTLMRHLKITSSADLDERLIAAMIKQAVELNRKKGDPTRR